MRDLSESDKTVTVGPHTYEVAADEPEILRRSEDYGATLQGHTNHQHLKITIDPRLADSVFDETLLHEVVHAIVTVAGIPWAHGDAEERFVAAFTPLLLDTLRRNPALLKRIGADR